MDNSRPILHIDDDEVDAMTVKRVLKTLGIPNKLINKNNGEEALEYLKDKNNEKPGVILLDLNMPRMNGKEFLEIMRNDSNLSTIPVIILTTSDIDTDLVKNNVIGYIVKAIKLEDFVAALKCELEKLYSCSTAS